MTWATRVGDVVRQFTVLGIDIITIGTEFLRQAATALDNFADGLKENIEPKKD